MNTNTYPRITVRVSQETLDYLREKAARGGTSVGELVKIAIDEYRIENP